MTSGLHAQQREAQLEGGSGGRACTLVSCLIIGRSGNLHMLSEKVLEFHPGLLTPNRLGFFAAATSLLASRAW